MTLAPTTDRSFTGRRIHCSMGPMLAASGRRYEPVQYLTGPVSLWTNCEWG